MASAQTKVPPPLSAALTAPASVYVYADVLEEMRFNGGWRADQVAGGLLVGAHYAHPGEAGTYIEVEGFIAATHVADITEFVRYLRIQWKSATASLRYHFPESEIVGWFLSGSEAETWSQAELVLHNTFFTQDWQRGLWLSEKGAKALASTGDALVDSEIGVIARP